ncbi:hypothetical protein Zmor_008799 [Zophobas morio]|uniref:Uncharacterized protein n=1 Tax=Zophobas morio TaxID=2755281 RepID=A0AA38HIK8_9CUCU|nr:hypothetical protein Zmor_008799 [Zophobas morio]
MKHVPFFDGGKIPWFSQEKYLRAIIDNKRSWQWHVYYLVAKFKATTKALFTLYYEVSKVSLRSKLPLYMSYFQPIMNHAPPAWTYDSTAIASALQLRDKTHFYA